MPSLAERILARIGWWHAGRVYERFHRTLADPRRTQQRTLERVLRALDGSDFARAHGLRSVRDVADLRRATPLHSYEDLRPYIDRVMAGETSALLRPGTRVHMFASSSGTTAAPKHVPVTDGFVREYRRGWNTFGLKLLRDHPAAILRHILQVTGRHDVDRASGGAPIGAITGLLARMQKGIVKRFYCGSPEMARIEPPESRYYALMRFAIVRDVAFAITANPATLIKLAQTADAHSEALIRDVRDGDLCATLVTDDALRRILKPLLRPEPTIARRLEECRRRHGRLAPRDYWNVTFLACWLGGSMRHYLPRLEDWWGGLPVRDIGLLASEGRVSVPLSDGSPSGPLDLGGSVFEFIPEDEWDSPQAETLLPYELEVGARYGVVLTNDSGLVRYRLGDVVKCVRHEGSTPVVEFLHRAGRVSSVAGEKLTEQQVVAAVSEVCRRLQIIHFDFVMAPAWGDPPFYRISTPQSVPDGFARQLDDELCRQNEEYESRRKSSRLNCLQVIKAPGNALERMERRMLASRPTAAPEQFKRPHLLTEIGADEKILADFLES